MIEGYRSTSLDKGIARAFAKKAETDQLNQVVLFIEMENKSNQYYVRLDRPDYTLYLSEKEVLLQAGLVGKVKSV